MKKFFKILIVALFVFFVMSCNTNGNSDEQIVIDSSVTETEESENLQTEQLVIEDEEIEGQAKEFNSKYICPNHCTGSGSSEAGECPVCGMEYIENLNTN